MMMKRCYNVLSNEKKKPRCKSRVKKSWPILNRTAHKVFFPVLRLLYQPEFLTFISFFYLSGKFQYQFRKKNETGQNWKTLCSPHCSPRLEEHEKAEESISKRWEKKTNKRKDLENSEPPIAVLTL